MRAAALLAALLAGVGCTGGTDSRSSSSSSAAPPASEDAGPTASASVESAPTAVPTVVAPASIVTDFSEDILSTSLELDLEKLEGNAAITVMPAKSGLASLDVRGLTIQSVTRYGQPAPHRLGDGVLDVDVSGGPSGKPVTFEVRYKLTSRTALEGYDAREKRTFIWPHFCGNLFPCKPDPADGLRFSLDVHGVGPRDVAVYPKTIATDAPSYMLALAVGRYEKIDLGKTKAGTQVWGYAPAHRIASLKRGTEKLARVLDFFERTYGPYRFGDEVATVSVRWPRGTYGGMEHHPFFHVEESELGDPYVHAHEAAHGWFGNGIRIRCWQDFVLSEGTSTYIAARALEVLGDDPFRNLGCELADACSSRRNTIARPPSCAPMDLVKSPLLSDVPYMKGAFFYRSVAEEIGAETVDRALAAFYRANAGQAAGMDEMVAALKDAAPDDAKRARIDALADGWLHETSCPANAERFCRRRR